MNTSQFLLIRHMKTKHPKMGVIKRILARYCYLSLDSIERKDVFHFILKTAQDLGLYKDLIDFAHDCLPDNFHEEIDPGKDYIAGVINGCCARIKFCTPPQDYPVPTKFQRDLTSR